MVNRFNSVLHRNNVAKALHNATEDYKRWCFISFIRCKFLRVQDEFYLRWSKQYHDQDRNESSKLYLDSVERSLLKCQWSYVIETIKYDLNLSFNHFKTKCNYRKCKKSKCSYQLNDFEFSR